ncbi:MAG: hypothetical protein HYZ17_15410 [Betaproteobacteria bacterium]|nr:hypothetical protein [Betaproteobacteria bacterium]
MPISWLTVLQTVPWAEVIKAAPQIADGARKLWSTVARKPAAPALQGPEENPQVPAAESRLEALEGRVAELEEAVAVLHEQMLASSELIKALADQNTQLVQRVEANRRRVTGLLIATMLLALAAAGGWGFVLLGAPE